MSDEIPTGTKVHAINRNGVIAGRDEYGFYQITFDDGNPHTCCNNWARHEFEIISGDRTEQIKQERLKLCRSLVLSGVRIVRDGIDHSDKANRYLENEKCIGFYSILHDYDAESDTFKTSHDHRTKAANVVEVFAFDKAVEGTRLK